jgi:hypothetical protein
MPAKAVMGDNESGIELTDEEKNPDCREDAPERNVSMA